jgi:hypothetical protein
VNPEESAPRGFRFTVLNAGLAAVHSAYELVGGVGLPGQSVFGLSGGVVVHATVISAWIRGSRGGSQAAKGGVALLNGLGLAGAAAHCVAWPMRWRRGLPLLEEGAEGLRGAWARWYNVVLYLWAVAAALAVARETPPGARRWVIAGLGSVPLVAEASHRKHDWAREQARLRARWWNRALQAKVAPTG